MRKITHDPLSTTSRVILSIVLSTPCFYLGYKVLTMEGGMIAIVFGTLMCILGITFLALLWAFPTASLIGEQGGRIFFPVEKLRGPQPMYGVAESKIANGMYEEAMAEYERIAAQYPTETKPYLEMLAVAIDHLEDPEWANAIYQHGMETMESDEDKEVLTKGYRAILD